MTLIDVLAGRAATERYLLRARSSRDDRYSQVSSIEARVLVALCLKLFGERRDIDLTVCDDLLLDHAWDHPLDEAMQRMLSLLVSYHRRRSGHGHRKTQLR